jgi:hypothetical protein
MTTENNTNIDETLEDAENGMRQRNPSALTSTGKPLSKVSMKYDIDGDGKLDPSEKAMRDMDTDDRGYLTNEQVYKVMLEQMKLQREVFGLKRMVVIFVSIILLLSLATLGTSFAAALLAKDTDVKDGNLVVKGGDGVVGTSNVASTFTVTEVDPSRRRLEIEGLLSDTSPVGITVTSITTGDAKKVAIQCNLGRTVFLKESCPGSTTTIGVQICPSTWSESESGGTYTYMDGAVTITCTGSDDNTCTVAFPTGATTCTVPTPTVLLRTANNYAILAKSGITTVPTSIITGDIAVSPISEAAMTGFGFAKDDNLNTVSEQITAPGQAFAANYGGLIASALTTAVSDMETAFTDAAGRVNTDASRININGGLLSEVTLTPGIYTFGTDVQLTGDIYLRGNANDVFIIQIATNLIQAAGKRVFLAGGAQAKNVFWQVSGSVSVGQGAHMEGVMLVKTAATFITGSSINGRVLTQTACALQQATIYSRICSNILCTSDNA